MCAACWHGVHGVCQNGSLWRALDKGPPGGRETWHNVCLMSAHAALSCLWFNALNMRAFPTLPRSLLRLALVTGALLLCGLLATPVHAQRLAADLSVRTSDSSESQRYELLKGYLCDLQRPARIYSYTWLGGLSGLLITQGALAWTSDADDESGRAARTGYLVGASMTGFGLGLIALTSRPETNSCDVMNSYVANTPEARAARLREGERRLFRSAQAARRQTAWWMHGLAVVLGVGVGLGLGLGYSDNALRATAQGVGTFAFTELRIWTRPTQAIEYAQRYEAMFPASR